MRARDARARKIGRVSGALLTVAAVLAAPASAGTATAGQVVLVSHTAGSQTTTPSGSSTGATSVSADGNVVVFTSAATNVVSGQTDSNGGTDVFLYERSTGAVSLISHTPAGPAVTANASSSAPQVSADGSYVIFVSAASNLVSGQTDGNGAADVFLYERASTTVRLVSHSPAALTTAGNSDSSTSVVSADGGVVVFFSHATDLVPGQVDTNGGSEVYAFERATGTVSLVSHTPGSLTTASNSGSFSPAVSADGAFLAFVSAATNLVTGQTDAAGTNDVFLYTRATAVVSIVSRVPAAATTAANASSGTPVVSANGGTVAFHSQATNLLAGQTDANGDFDVFVWTRATGDVAMASHAPGSATTAGNGRSTFASISADGSVVAFISRATDLVSGQSDANGGDDVFVYSGLTGNVALTSHAAGSVTTTANAVTPAKSLSADGGWVTFYSTASNLVAGQDNSTGGQNVFLQPIATGTSTLVSHVPGIPAKSAGGAQNLNPAVSADGVFVAFVSGSTNLVVGQTDSNSVSDVFLFRRTATAVVPADFDGNGRTDISVFRPTAGAWLISGQPTVFLGAAGDIPVPCDYDGDGNTDAAVFRASVGGWYVDGQGVQFFGFTGDVPVPGDFDGDGDCDIAIFRPSVGGWYIQSQSTVFFGLAGDIPVPGDYDGNGTTDVAIFRPSVGGWYRNGAPTTFFGLSGDIPVPGDYDGNGTTDVAIFRPSVGGWYAVGRPTLFLGLSSDLPQPGDYDGNGATDIAVYRSSTGAWFVGNQSATFFGTSGDIPQPLPSAIRMAAP